MRNPLIYCAGAFSANEDGDTAFHKARAVTHGELVRAAGFVPLVPHVAVLQPPAELGDRAVWKLAMSECLELLRRADGIYLIPGWQKSRGARVEHYLGARWGLPVFESIPDLRMGRMHLDWELRGAA